MNDDDIVKEFLVESAENLDQIEQDFVEIEKDPENKELIASIFRAMHTIKGTSGFFGFSKLEKTAHAGENLLSLLRDGVLHITPEITTALLSTVDAIRSMLATIEETSQDGDDDFSELIETLKQLSSAENSSQESAPSPQEKVPEAKKETVPPQFAIFDDDDEKKETPPQPSPEKPKKTPVKDKPVASVAESAIRVDVGLLDKIMNLVGELVLARNQILQFTTKQNDSAFISASQRLNLITSDLQESVMKTRMQPISNIWNKLPRVVRDLANSCGKQVEIVMEGKETELDKTLIEAIKDPLTHLVRNAVDHGIELPETRVQHGKAQQGILKLKAYHEGGQVNIEISDDGAGISAEKLKKKALEKQLLPAEQLEEMREHELMNIIFMAGFSTAEKVTNVSGRGVGMDVVKTNIEKIGGTIEIQSQPGEGTTFKVKIPLTLAIIPALIVHCQGNRFAIPQVSLVELVRFEKNHEHGVELIHGVPVYRLRDQLLPLVSLAHELKISQGSDVFHELQDVPVINIVVLQVENQQFGLIVDGIIESQEIVVKPLDHYLSEIHCFSGATIMGDGKIALILDVMGIAQKSKVISEIKEVLLAEMAEKENDLQQRQMFLITRSPDDGRLAIPLSLVSRLERLSLSQIEKTGDREVVQYRGGIMPLVRVSQVLVERRTLPRRDSSLEEQNNNMLDVVVYGSQEKNIGFVVDQILDIVSHPTQALSPPSRDGVKGTLVIKSRVTEVLDMEEIVRRCDDVQ